MTTSRPRRGRRRPLPRLVAPLTLLFTGIVLVAACSGPSTGSEARSHTHRAPIVRSTIEPTVLANSELASGLYRSLRSRNTNFVFSPFAASLGLAQVGAGAAGDTASQLVAVQHAGSDHSLDAGLNSLDLQINSRSGDRQSAIRQGRVALELPVAVWGQQDTNVERPFLDQLSRYFGTGMRLVDFRSDPDAARNEMNNWTEQATQGQMSEVVGPGQITDATRLAVTSAARLSAPWDLPFDTTRTRDAPFHDLGGATTDTTTMFLHAPRGLLYAKAPGWQAVMLPYLGRQLAMVVLEPDAGQFTAVETSLDGVRFQSLLAALRPTPVDLALPRFQFSTRVRLPRALMEQGATLVFDPAKADLSGVTHDEALSLSDFDQQTLISADEEGTQANATTVVAASAPAATPFVPLVVDRPFVVAVVDRASGEPIMLGRVVELSD